MFKGGNMGCGSKRLMYHGTDQNVLNMTEDERKRAAYVCGEISKISYGVLKENNVSYTTNTAEQVLSKSRLRDYWFTVCSAMIKYEGRLNNSTLYQYDELFITNSIERAKIYAKNSFIYGEQGSIAYDLYKGASYFTDFNRGLLNEEEDIINEFILMSNRERHPVIILFEDLPIEDIRFENGKPVRGFDVYSDDLVDSFRLDNKNRYNLSEMKVIKVI